MKRDQKFAFANSSSHGWFDMVERLKMAILTRERTRMLDFFEIYFLLRYKAIDVSKNFRERCQNSRFYIGHVTANDVLPFASLIKC